MAETLGQLFHDAVQRFGHLRTWTHNARIGKNDQGLAVSSACNRVVSHPQYAATPLLEGMIQGRGRCGVRQLAEPQGWQRCRRGWFWHTAPLVPVP